MSFEVLYFLGLKVVARLGIQTNTPNHMYLFILHFINGHLMYGRKIINL